MRTSDNKIQITLENLGNAHVKIGDLEVSLPDGTSLAKQESLIAYVLPGEKRSWDLVTAIPWTGSRIRLSAGTDEGRVHADLEVEGG